MEHDIVHTCLSTPDMYAFLSSVSLRIIEMSADAMTLINAHGSTFVWKLMPVAEVWCLAGEPNL